MSPRARKRILWGMAAVIAVVAVALGVWTIQRRAIPHYDGKTVYEWMHETSSTDLDKNPALKAIGTNAVPYLAEALMTESTPYERWEWVRNSTLQEWLERLGLTKWTHSSYRIRRQAAFTLLAFGPEIEAALPALHTELLRPDAADRRLVIDCITEMGPPERSIPVLVKAWDVAGNEREDLKYVRDSLLHALGEAGPVARPAAMPIIMQALEDPDEDLRERAASALAKWGVEVPDAVPKLLPLLESEETADAAVRALGVVTNQAPKAIPKIRSLERSTDEYTRAVAAMTLWRLGEDPEPRIKTLISLLSTEQGRGHAARFLGEMGSEAEKAVPALLEASQQNLGAHVDMYDRARCAMAVLKITGPHPEAHEVLAQALAYRPNSWIRTTVAKDIAELGRLGKPMIPALKKALNDSDREVRHAARIALDRLSGERAE